jgi:hypothetical protein
LLIDPAVAAGLLKGVSQFWWAKPYVFADEEHSSGVHEFQQLRNALARTLLPLGLSPKRLAF